VSFAKELDFPEDELPLEPATKNPVKVAKLRRWKLW